MSKQKISDIGDESYPGTLLCLKDFFLLKEGEEGWLIQRRITGTLSHAMILDRFSFLATIQGFFLDILKKTQAQKNSKLKQIFIKTQAKCKKNSKTANST